LPRRRKLGGVSSKPAKPKVRYKRTSQIGITEGRRADGLLLHADLLRKSFNSAKDALFVLDAKVPPVILECNQAASKIFGYNKSEMVGRTTAFLHVSSESLRKFQAQLYPAIKKNEYFSFDYQMKRKDGSVFPSDHTVTPLLDDHGKRIGWVSVVRDLTEQRQAEETLRESEEKYRALVENSPNMIGILQDGILKYVNKTGLERLGWNYEEITSPSFDPIENVVAERFRSLVKENVGRRLRGEDIPPYEISLVTRDGSEICVVVRGARITYKGRPADEFVFIDITERKQMQQELLRSNQFLTSVIENADVWLDVLDEKERVLIWNRAAEVASGYSREEVVGHWKIWEWLYPDQEYRKQITETVADILQHGRVDTNVETKIRRKDGETRIISWNDRALTDSDGKAIGTIAIGHDITELREMQDELERYSKHLKESEEKLRALHQHALQLGSASNIEEIAESTLDAIQFALGFDVADVYLVAGDCLRVRGTRGAPTGLSEEHLNGRGLVAKAARSQATIRVSDTTKEPDYVDRKGWDWTGPHTMLSELAVPVVVDAETVAVLNAESIRLDAFSSEDQRLLETLAAHVGSEMHRLKRGQELETYSKHLEELVEERTKRLLESEERYRSIVQNIPAMVWTSSEKGDAVFITPNVKELHGYTPEEVYTGGQPVWSKHIHPDDRAKLSEGYEALFTDGRVFDVEYRYQRPDGKWLYLNDRADLVYEKDGVRYTDGVTTDITERKKIETALRESEERFRGIAERSVDGIFEVDLEGRLTYASPAVERILGYELGEVVGTLFHKYLSTSELPKAASSLSSLRDGKNVEGVEFCALKRDGSQVFVEIGCSPIVTGAKVVGAQGIIRDTTERRKTEERLHQAERFAVIGETATMVGHDLRNPLQGIAGAAYNIRKQLRNAPDPSTKEMLAVIDNGVEYANGIINDLLEFSREIQLQRFPATPRSMVTQTLKEVKVPDNIRIDDTTVDAPEILVDEPKIRRALMNLIKNAIDAMPEGGKLSVSSVNSESEVSITVSDTGSGIAQDQMEKIGTLLYTTKAKGIGLGLPICKRIVEAHGGSMSVESIVGKGTTFTLKLPIGGEPS